LDSKENDIFIHFSISWIEQVKVRSNEIYNEEDEHFDPWQLWNILYGTYACNEWNYCPKASCRVRSDGKAFWRFLFLQYWQFFFSIFTRESSYCFQRVLAIAILFVCLSVTRVEQSKTVQARITKSLPSAAWKTPVSGT